MSKSREFQMSLDMAALHNIRVVTAVEVAAGKRLDEALVKQITGGDRITARFLYQEFFDFTPSFKVLLAANHRPDIRGVDEGIWRRIRLIPFEVTIPRGERDPRLAQNLRTELAGILAWIVEGARKWHESGLMEPPEVTIATALYREQSDSLGDFIAAATVEKKAATVPVGHLFAAYEVWAGESGTDAWKKDTFSKAMKERGFAVEQRREAGGPPRRLYVGLAMSDEGKRLLSHAELPVKRQDSPEERGRPI